MSHDPPIQARAVADAREIGARYDEAAVGFEARFAAKTATAARYARMEETFVGLARRAERILEVGAGTGRILRRLPGPQVVGIDASLQMARHACETGLEVARADAIALPFEGAAFEVVIAASGFLQYVDARSALVEWARVLVPGGRLGLHLFAPHRVLERRFWRHRRATGAQPLAEVDDAAAGAGLRLRSRVLYRNIRFPPYLVAIPERFAGRLWTHGIAVYEELGRSPVRFGPPAWACPHCKGRLSTSDTALRCPTCDRTYLRRDGVWDFLG